MAGAVQETMLITGGAGYIASHLVAEVLRRTQYRLVLVDDLSTGHKASMPAGAVLASEEGSDGARVVLEVGSLMDPAFLSATFERWHPTYVAHLAASIAVDESCRDPCKYYHNNVTATTNLVHAMEKATPRVKYIVFSSTAAVFGTPGGQEAIEETAPRRPESAYGDTKLASEGLLKWANGLGIRSVVLRFFNACGADENGEIGEVHDPQTHLIPIVLEVAQGTRKELKVFGEDYPTPDGTCVRDYVHCTDLADAHIKAFAYLRKGGESDDFNLGSGKGYSVKEVVDVCRRVTGHPIPSVSAPRREGDPPVLVASSEKAIRVLGWERKYNDLQKIVESMWRFVQTHPNGYD